MLKNSARMSQHKPKLLSLTRVINLQVLIFHANHLLISWER